MKILITGQSGFIGGYLTKRLEKKHQVVGLMSDLRDFQDIEKELKEVNPDIIIHLAARTEVEKSFYDPLSFSHINYCGTINLIEKAKDLKNLKLFIFASTMETYGWQPDYRPFTETTRQHPNAPYAVAKVGCEKYLEYAGRAYKFPYTILRQSNTYGRKDNDFFIVEQIITQMLKNPKEIKLGNAEPYRNFLFIDDLIDLYETLIVKRKKAEGEVFVTGPDNALQIQDLVELIACKLKWNGKVIWSQKPKRVGEIYYLNSDPAKAKRLLGWEPKINLGEGLDKTIRMWK